MAASFEVTGLADLHASSKHRAARLARTRVAGMSAPRRPAQSPTNRTRPGVLSRPDESRAGRRSALLRRGGFAPPADDASGVQGEGDLQEQLLDVLGGD